MNRLLKTILCLAMLVPVLGAQEKKASAANGLPPLIDREILFGNPERADPKISPDGAQLGWLAPDQNGVINVWLSALDGVKLRPKPT